MVIIGYLFFFYHDFLYPNPDLQAAQISVVRTIHHITYFQEEPSQNICRLHGG